MKRRRNTAFIKAGIAIAKRSDSEWWGNSANHRAVVDWLEDHTAYSQAAMEGGVPDIVRLLRLAKREISALTPSDRSG